MAVGLSAGSSASILRIHGARPPAPKIEKPDAVGVDSRDGLTLDGGHQAQISSSAFPQEERDAEESWLAAHTGVCH